jgi:Fe-S-cluster containining protein
MPDSLERIYRSVPVVACKGLCAETCGPIEMSEVERRRIAARGVVIPPAAQALEAIAVGVRSGDCPALVDNRCSVYEVRPLICRLWGAVESMPCGHGCEVTPGLLMDAGAGALIGRSLKIGVSDAG